MIPQVRATVESYDRIAPYYVHLTGMQREARRIINRWIAHFLAIVPDLDLPILDLGCGGGGDLEVLRSMGARVVGMDCSQKMLGYARQRLPDTTLVRMDAASQGWKRAVFGGVWASGILYHIPKRVLGGVLGSIRQSLIPGGAFYFNYLVGSGEGIDQHQNSPGIFPRFYAYYQPQEMARLLSGFQPLKWEPQPREFFGGGADHVLAVSTK
jgi:SAM-dependent methyltransferase